MYEHKLLPNTVLFSCVLNTTDQVNQSGSHTFINPEMQNPANSLSEVLSTNQITFDLKTNIDIDLLKIDHESCSICAWPGLGNQECWLSVSSDGSSSGYYNYTPNFHILIPSLYKGPFISSNESNDLPPYAVAIDKPEDGSEPKLICSEYLKENYVPYKPYGQLPKVIKDLKILSSKSIRPFPFGPEGCAQKDGECVPPMMPKALLDQFSIILP